MYWNNFIGTEPPNRFRQIYWVPDRRPDRSYRPDVRLDSPATGDCKLSMIQFPVEVKEK
jgi:hypothetical protein